MRLPKNAAAIWAFHYAANVQLRACRQKLSFVRLMYGQETTVNLSEGVSRLSKLFAFFVLALSLVSVSMEAVATCSDSKVKRLSGQGKTVAAIARSCDMDADDVRSILEDDDEEPEPELTPSRRQTRRPLPDPRETEGLAPGTPLSPCGCWGVVVPGYREPNGACRNGFATPRMCPQMCPAGGYAWQGVCG